MNDPSNRTQIEIDVVVMAAPDLQGPRRILSPGEATWGEVMGRRHVERPRRARDLLAVRGFDTRDTRLACYSAAGFTGELRGMAEREPVLQIAQRAA